VSSDDLLTTSPLWFAHPGRSGRLVAGDARGGRRFRLGSRGAEVAAAFLEPRPANGLGADELQAARDAGLLVPDEESESLALWERHGWSRPAYLLFSQTDVPYAELEAGSEDAGELVAARRRAVEEYLAEGEYPRWQPLAAGEAVALPEARPVSPRLSSLVSRRSVRGFARTPPGAAELADALHAASAGTRTAAADREGGDPFRLLNSFYSWAHLLVAVQAVADLPRGVFEYDWREHRLLTAAGPPSEEALAACVQGQRWVLGTGFVVFVVADLRRYAWLYRQSRAYLHVLMQVGELGQELIMAATELGLAGWTTPAVHESRCAALLGLPRDDGVDVLSMTKLGRPGRR
jgi:SagB-type dehydrogenase family enzyme